MAREPVLSGEIPTDGVLELLREIEGRRITGKIRFVVGPENGEVELVAGQIALDQDPLPNGADPVEALLQARSGLYTVHAVLPALPISQGDEFERRGSLSVHVPADLMTYCEQAGLTGTLELRNAGQLVEIVYEAGEMLAIRLDGREDVNLDHVFAWDEGSFFIRVRTTDDVRSRLPPGFDASEPDFDLPELPDLSIPELEPVTSRHAALDEGAPTTTHVRDPEEAPTHPPARRLPEEDASEREPTVRFARPEPDPSGPTRRFARVDEGAASRALGAARAPREERASRRRTDNTGQQFLRVVEVALTEVVTVREKARASVRSVPPPPKARPSVRPPPARPAKAKDSTVRIVWLGGEPVVESAIPTPRVASASLDPKPSTKVAPPEPAKASESATKASEVAPKSSELPAKVSPSSPKPSRELPTESPIAAPDPSSAAAPSTARRSRDESPGAPTVELAPPRAGDALLGVLALAVGFTLTLILLRALAG